jgi:hypothetical protein
MLNSNSQSPIKALIFFIIQRRLKWEKLTKDRHQVIANGHVAFGKVS